MTIFTEITGKEFKEKITSDYVHKILCDDLTHYNFVYKKGYNEDTYNILLQCEGIALENFEGFYRNVGDHSQGRYEGQVGRVKSSEWSYNDFTLPNGNQIVRDDEILKFINNLCDALDTSWLSEQDNKFETIEELVNQFNIDAPFSNIFLYACLCGKEYMNKSGYLNYDLYLPKYTKQGFPFEKLNEESDTSNVYTFNADSHIKKMKASKEVDSFKNEDDSIEKVNDDFDL